jgi:hypothetical protein
LLQRFRSQLGPFKPFLGHQGIRFWSAA